MIKPISDIKIALPVSQSRDCFTATMNAKRYQMVVTVYMTVPTLGISPSIAKTLGE
jgi:hypothetical protein